MTGTSYELHYLNGPDNGKRVPLVDNLITLGRSRKNTIVIDDPSISRVHLKFQVDDQKILVEDGGSSHGTTVNGMRIDSLTRLNDRDVIQAGDQKFEVHVIAEEEPDEQTMFNDPGQMKEQFEEARIKEGPDAPPPAATDLDPLADPEDPTQIAPKGGPAPPPAPPTADETVQLQPPPIDPPANEPSTPTKSPPLPAMQTGDDEDFMDDDDATNILEPSEKTRIISGGDMSDKTRIIQTNDQTRILQSPAPAPAAPSAPPPAYPAPAPPVAAGGSKLGPLWFVAGLALGAVLMLGLHTIGGKAPSYTYHVEEMAHSMTAANWDQMIKSNGEKGFVVDQTVASGTSTIIIFKRAR